MQTIAILEKINTIEQQIKELKKLTILSAGEKKKVTQQYTALKGGFNQTLSDKKAINLVNKERQKMYTS